jgi:hypothetical protein
VPVKRRTTRTKAAAGTSAEAPVSADAEVTPAPKRRATRKKAETTETS